MDWFLDEPHNEAFLEYLRHLPPDDQDVLRQYFNRIFAKYKERLPVQDRSQAIQEIIRENILGLTDRKIRKVTKIIQKAIEFYETVAVHVSAETDSSRSPEHPPYNADNNIEPENYNQNANKIRSASDHKDEGNMFFKANKFREAISCYTRAIAMEPLNATYFSNRAMCYLKMELFEQALGDAEKAVSIDPHTQKYKHRLALAWAGLGCHEKCCEILEGLCGLISEIEPILEKEYRLVRNTRGEFDFAEMENKVKRRDEIQIADFIGPVSIEYTRERGYSLFAKRNIHKDEIIYVAKAVVIAGYSEKTDINNETNKTTNNEQATQANIDNLNQKLLNGLSSKAAQSKLTAYRLYHLYSNKPERIPVPIELYRSSGYQLVRDLDFPPYSMADLKRILQNKTHTIRCNPSPTEARRQEPRGVWYIPSFISHSCLPTARIRFIGDVSIIQANTDIDLDSEITLSYVPVYNFLTVEERRRELLEGWGFECRCELCEFESDPRNIDLLEQSVQFCDQSFKLSSLSNNPLQILGPSQYKLLGDLVSLAGELHLGRRWFNAAVWQAIIALTKLRIAPNDCPVYLEFIEKITPYLCELEFMHQLFLWNNYLSYFQYIQIPDANERRIELASRYREVKNKFFNIF